MRDIYVEKQVRINGELAEGTEKLLLDYLLPEQFKHGSTRRVFELNHRLTRGNHNLNGVELVIKVACNYENSLIDGIQCNINEWNVWCHSVNRPSIRKWLCPVVSLSEDGKFLTMVRCEPVKSEDLPSHVPYFLKDVHCLNWGWYKDPVTNERRVVMLDYGNILPKYLPDDYDEATDNSLIKLVDVLDD